MGLLLLWVLCSGHSVKEPPHYHSLEFHTGFFAGGGGGESILTMYCMQHV